jgi:glycine/D-amino acid oxidase-like deaminating enzyme
MNADVVVIGGGIVGSASAHYLAKRGLKVVLIERGEIGRDQSSRNWGFVRQQGRHPVELPLMMESNRMWGSLEQELDADLEWMQRGNLALASDEKRLGQFEEWCVIAREHSLDTVILGPSDLRQRFPLMAEGFAGAMYTPSDGHASPEKVSAAFAASAQRLGGSVFTGEAVEAIIVSGGAVAGVRTEQREVVTGYVVCAAGALSSRLLSGVGVSLPQRTVRATVASTTPMPPVAQAGIWADQISLRQRRDGRIVFAAGARADYDLTINVFRHLPHFLPNYWKNKALFRFHVGRPLLADLGSLVPGSDRARHPYSVRNALEPMPSLKRVVRGQDELEKLFPSLGHVTVERSWAGNVDATPDAIPVIDALPQLRGLVVGTGFSGHGFALGPVAGRLISELIADGEASFDLHSMRLSRFAERDLVPPRSVL